MADKTYLDWPFLDGSHRKLKSDLLAWCEQYPFDHGEQVDEICRQLVADMGKAGWLKNCVPGAWGGAAEKLDVRSIALCRETLAYYSGLADFSLAMQGLGSGPLSLFGSDAQRQQYLPAVAAGNAIAAFALSEAEAGSDVAAIATTAEQSGKEYVLNGGKTWISNGGIADFYCVFARTGEEPGSRGLSAFVVESSNPGLEVMQQIETIAPHPLATLKLND
jgi:acyl-CoA dehydrogenase